MSRFAEYTLTRIAGWSFDAIEPLQMSNTLLEIIQAEKHLEVVESLKEELCERLHLQIQGREERRERLALINLRRCVYNNRMTSEDGKIEKIAPYLYEDETLIKNLHVWEKNIGSYIFHLNRLDDMYDQEWDQVKENLRQVAKCKELQTGILFAQPRLYKKLCDILFDNNLPWKKNERTILSYCYRMATKVSPFSMFTASGLAKITAVEEWNFPSFQKKSLYTFNAGALDKFVKLLQGSSLYKKRLLVKNNSSILSREDDFLFLKYASDYEMKKTPGAVQEMAITLKKNPLVDLIWAFLSQEETFYTVESLINQVREVLPEFSSEKIEELVEKLIDAGFLILSLKYDSNNINALEQIIQSESVPDKEMNQELSDLYQKFRSLNGDSPDILNLKVSDIANKFSKLNNCLLDQSEEISSHNLVHHNTYFADGIEISQDTFRPFLDKIEKFASILPLFNTDYIFQQRVKNFYFEKYGETEDPVPVMEFFSQFCASAMDENSDQYNINPFDEKRIVTPDIILMQEERKKFIEELYGNIKDGFIDEEFIDRWGKIAEKFKPPLAAKSVGITAQICPDEKGNSNYLIVNKVVSGYGTLFAHAANAWSDNPSSAWFVESIHENLKEINSEFEPVDLTGIFGFDGQIRPFITNRTITYPGDSVADPDGRFIPWSDLSVIYDQKRKMPVLIDVSRQKKILPIHMGALSPVFFPPFYRMMYSFGPSFTPDFSLVDYMENLQPENSQDEIRHYQRIKFGPLVLMRETWSIPSRLLPVQEKGESPVFFYKRLRKWAYDLGMPGKVFVTPMKVSEFMRDQSRSNNFQRAHKPFYVSWDDFTSLRIFQRFIQEAGSNIYISEMLPGPEQAQLFKDGKKHVFEFLFEWYEK